MEEGSEFHRGNFPLPHQSRHAFAGVCGNRAGGSLEERGCGPDMEVVGRRDRAAGIFRPGFCRGTGHSLRRDNQRSLRIPEWRREMGSGPGHRYPGDGILRGGRSGRTIASPFWQRRRKSLRVRRFGQDVYLNQFRTAAGVDPQHPGGSLRSNLRCDKRRQRVCPRSGE